MTWQNGAAESNASPFYASIGFNLFCTNYPTQIPSDCECDKGLPLVASYTTKLNTSTSTNGCFWCWGNRGAVAAVEDWAIVIEHNVKTGEIIPLSAGKGAAISECSSTINTDFFVKIVDVAKNIFELSQLQEPSGGLLGTVSQIQKQQIINNLANSITGIIQTPPINRISCGSNEKTLSLFDYRGWRILKANTPTFYRIFSASALRSSGYTAWSSNARIISQFTLGGVLQMGTNPGQEFCCSSPIANWVSFTTPDLPSNRPTLQSLLGFYWPQAGTTPVVNTDFGYKQGYTTPGCITLAQSVKRNSDISVQQLQDGIYLNDLKGEILDCTISDILGRVVGQYKGEAVNRKIWDFTTNNTPQNGIYIIQVNRKSGISQTFKIVKS